MWIHACTFNTAITLTSLLSSSLLYRHYIYHSTLDMGNRYPHPLQAHWKCWEWMEDFRKPELHKKLFQVNKLYNISSRGVTDSIQEEVWVFSGIAHCHCNGCLKVQCSGRGKGFLASLQGLPIVRDQYFICGHPLYIYMHADHSESSVLPCFQYNR